MDWLETETTSAPAAEPLTITEVKAQSRIDVTDEDILLTAYILAARKHVEKITGTRLITQTVKLRTSGLCDLMRLPLAPVQSITSVKYLDADNVEQTLSASYYTSHLHGLDPFLRRAYGQTWPSVYDNPEAVRIVAVVGYGAAGSNVPADLLHAMKLVISHWFKNREPVNIGSISSDLAMMVDALLANHRCFGF